MPQLDMGGEERLDILHRRPVRTVTLRRAGGAGLMPVADTKLLRFPIAAINHIPCHLILTEGLACPLPRRLWTKTELIQLIPYAHHVVVMGAGGIDSTVRLHLRTDDLLVTGGDTLQLPLPFAPLPLPLEYLLRCRLYLLLAEGHGIGIVIHLRVMGDTTQSADILTLLVIHHAIRPGIVLVAIEERLGIIPFLQRQVVTLVQLIAEERPDAVAADGTVAEECVGVGDEPLKQLRHLVARPGTIGMLADMVDIDHRHACHLHDVTLTLAALHDGGDGKQGTGTLVSCLGVVTVGSRLRRHRGIVFNQPDDVLHRRLHRTCVCEMLITRKEYHTLLLIIILFIVSPY